MTDEKDRTQPPSPHERRNALVERAYEMSSKMKKSYVYYDPRIHELVDLVHELAKELRAHCQDLRTHRT